MHSHCKGSVQHPRSARWHPTATASGAFTVGCFAEAVTSTEGNASKT